MQDNRDARGAGGSVRAYATEAARVSEVAMCGSMLRGHLSVITNALLAGSAR